MAVSINHGGFGPDVGSSAQSKNTDEDLYNLCIECQKLELYASRFVVSPGNLKDFTSTPTSLRLNSTTNPMAFGTLVEIWDRSSRGCNLCNLVICAVQQDGKGCDEGLSILLQKHGTSTCFLSWKIDGRHRVITEAKAAKQPRALTRRIHLRWDDSQLQDSYLVLVGSDDRLSTSDAERVWNSSLLFLGRPIGNRGQIQARMRSWIDLCLNKHQGPCFQEKRNQSVLADRTETLIKVPRRLTDMLSHSYFGVIDVLNMQLTELPLMHEVESEEIAVYQYVALSYVWGEASSYKTTLQNVMQHRTHGGLESVFHKFPKAVQDAIKLVRQLGVNYIWIDALCIIQDSARSWKLNAYNMDLIYGNAMFTICAADGPDASVGLLAMDEVSGTGNKDQLIASCTKDVRLMISRPPEAYIEASIWNRRAWTFQERLLSRRCLIFAGSRVYFQCQSTGMSEDIYTDREGAGWSLDFTDAPLQTFQQLPLRSFWVYMKVVELYTIRSLTRENDVLAAFSGMSNVMEQTMRAPLTFGLPTSHFDLALLWDHLAPLRRRTSPSLGGDVGQYAFPSWSWTGWTGNSIRYPRDFIADCLDDVKEWLRLRTWIRWYARNDNGDLCPLWDEKKWQTDLSEHEIWQGYSFHRSSGSREIWNTENISQESRISRKNHSSDSLALSYESESSEAWPDSPSTKGSARVRRTKDRASNRKHQGTRLGKREHGQRSPERKDGSPESSWRVHQSHTIPTSRGLPVLQPTGILTKVHVKPGQDSQIAPLPEEIKGSWMQRLQDLLLWLKDSYRDEIVVYWIEVCLSTLNLLTYLLGTPMFFTRAPRPQQGVGMNYSQRNQVQGNMGPHQRQQKYNYIGAPPPPPPHSAYVQNGQGGFRAYPLPPPPPHGYVGDSHPPPHPHPPPPPPHSAYVQTSQGGAGAYPPPPPRALGQQAIVHEGFAQRAPPGMHRKRSPSPSSSIASQSRRVHDTTFEEDGIVEPEDTESEPTFRITLKEFPYLPAIVPFRRKLRNAKIGLMPILQFWTWHSFLRIHSPPLDKVGLTRCNIADKFGDWCGSIMLDNGWLGNTETARHEFIALSEAKRFTDEECDTWSYYIPKEREESEWDLFFVMLIEWSDGRWERVGLGKVFKEAFRDATWKEIVLA